LGCDVDVRHYRFIKDSAVLLPSDDENASKPEKDASVLTLR
jgi:hypothetical protein